MSDGERACLVPSKEARTGGKTKFQYLSASFHSLKLLQALELGGRFDSELGINTQATREPLGLDTGRQGARILGYVSLPYRY